jgi:hypothetical protein
MGRVTEGTDSGDSELEASLEAGTFTLSREVPTDEVLELTEKTDSGDEEDARIDSNERGPSEEFTGGI